MAVESKLKELGIEMPEHLRLLGIYVPEVKVGACAARNRLQVIVG